MNQNFFTSSYHALLAKEYKRTIFKKLTTHALPVFTKGGDIISINTQVSSIHDPVITALITSLAKARYNDFLLDIGANIGLITCQTGSEFSVVHMFEPNPLCQNILEVNTAITLDTSKLTLHRYALGSEEKRVRLIVPKHNWGGGYIDDPSNSYDESTLAGKDGFDEFNEQNYLQFNVEIKNTVSVMNKLFTSLSNKGQKRGVIKIDTEGFEPIVIQGIAQALPLEVECYIIFESFNEKLDISTVINQFKGRAIAYKIIENKPWKRRWPKLVKLLFLLFKDKITWQLDGNTSGNWKGDIVLHITAN